MYYLHRRGCVLRLLEGDNDLPIEHGGRVVFGHFLPRQVEGVGRLFTVGLISVHHSGRGNFEVGLVDLHLGAEKRGK